MLSQHCIDIIQMFCVYLEVYYFASHIYELDDVLFQCPAGGNGKRSLDNQPQRVLADAQRFQMMDQAVQPLRTHPTLLSEGQR